MLGVLLWFAGLFYLLENTGDWYHEYANAREPGNLRYWDTVYWLVITASTIGYGDYYPVTDLGKITMVLYLSGAIASFASNLPEIAELVGNQPKYAGAFEQMNNQRQFIVVCGNINYDSVKNFLKDFFHPAREDVNCEIVFLNKNEPDLEFEGLLKREKTRVTYFQGTMLNPYDLQRVAVDRASAVLVLCNKFSPDPTWEDAANIMRVISLKNYCENTRVIIQLLHYSSKAFLLNIPGWDWRRDDQAVCLNEVKFGLLAQSCLAPGFFTLASNIIMTTGHLRAQPEMARYCYCASFYKKNSFFQEVAEICFTRLNLILIAVEQRKYEGGQIFINPRNKRITANAIGLFLTDSSDSAKRAWFYCRVCHENMTKMADIKKCSCKKLAKARYEYHVAGKDKNRSNGLKHQVLLKEESYTSSSTNIIRRRKLDVEENQETRAETAKMMYDSTGCFHWCTSRTIEECILTRQEATVTMFAGHIVIAIFSDETSPLLGLRNLVMPLRASNIAYNDLRHIIIIGKLNYVKREWYLLRNLPKISVLDGDPLSRADLRAVKINLSRTCIVLSAKTPEKSEPVLADKEIIMSALNMKNMNFGADFVKMDEEGEEEEEEDQHGTGDINMSSIPILLDLAFANNVRYLDDHEMYMSDVELYKTLPFASGMAMARGILDSLMAATYFNASALRLLRQWVTGGANIDLEKSLAEGAGLRGGYSTPATLASRDRVRVEEIVLKESQWARYAEYGSRFGDLYAAALRENGTQCLAIYRLVEEDLDGDNDIDSIRVTLGAPDNSALLQPDDHIIALVQFEDDKEKVE
ncbi:calcium-activated potassium channel slowpoke [Eurytemora carolleeae]|uniref:calcium-activated potassium channel slowpoke n=1 Tax=Eurytemora carolleeae TaxID=1294199 RepID=UPI000C77E648|nr:calcium-activated potassium channel slowpoke [Eurytemora carolleeae]|eukprot:XP_023325746.1 calcium-activated potassium channel slowpoke-like [Eurytemora affinis]